MVQGVYVDILLVTNFFVNILLLSLVEAVCGRTKQRWRKVASAFAASLFSLSIFFPPPALGIGAEVTELLFKVLCSLIMVAIAFSWCSLAEFIKEWLVLLTVTMLFYALMGAMQGLFAGTGLFVFDHAIYFHLRTPVFILCLAGAYTLVWSLNRVLRSVCRTDELYRVTLEVDMPVCREWIGFVDSDDSIAPEMYETLLTYAQRDGAQIAVCDYLLVTEAGEPLPSSYRLEEDKVLDRVGALEQMNRGHFKVAWNRLYRRELFEMVRFPVGKIHEDEYTAHQFYWQCERITIAAKPLYFYVQRGGSIIHTDSPQKTMDLAEGIFQRACFEQEQQLTRLAIEAAKTSMLVFAQAHRRKDLQPAQRRWCAEMRGRMNALAKTLLKSGSGSRADRIKFRLFLCSPTLYRAALLTKSWMNKIGF